MHGTARQCGRYGASNGLDVDPSEETPARPACGYMPAQIKADGVVVSESDRPRRDRRGRPVEWVARRE
jgi:hypothetical protein